MFLFNIPILSQNNFELNTLLMNSTFRIEGSGKTGTVFVIGQPLKKDSTRAFYVLVTANHVLSDIKTDYAVLFLREKIADIYSLFRDTIKIRDNGIPLWTKHPDVDVAAMYLPLPRKTKIDLLTTNFLATDSLIASYGIHPGDELYCLGYPFGISANQAGFPILRSGTIASYPLLPSKLTKYFLFDFQIFGGNSGGPVYFIGHDRGTNGTVFLGSSVNFIVGLVSKQRTFEEEIKSVNEVTKKEHPLGLAIVIPSTFIRETIELLPNIEK